MLKRVFNFIKYNKFKKAFKITFKVTLGFFLLLVCIFSGLICGAIAGVIFTTKPLTDADLKISEFTSIIYDNKGNIIAQLKGNENKNRVWVPLSNLPLNLKNAYISIEDERFYNHCGIDAKRTASAILSYVIPGSKIHGGSTITQQVVKNVTGDDLKSVPRKIRELWRALQLENKYDKDDILEVYVNVIYMGYDLYGVSTASKAYFNKDVSELNLAECAVLAGITNNPGKYNPLTTSGRTEVLKRQHLILNKMLQLGKISQHDMDLALNEKLVFNDEYKLDSIKAAKTSYFVDKVIVDVRDDFMKKGYTKEQANTMIYNTGVKIYSTQDTFVQNTIDQVFNDIDNFPANKTIMDKDLQAQAAIAIVDQYNGQLLGVYGGSGAKTNNLSYNRATMMKRQPGSSFKPLVAYGPAIDNKLITPATVFDDSPSRLDLSNKDKLWPHNFSNDYMGLVSARKALDLSINVVAAKVLNLDINSGLAYIKKLGIDRSNEKNLAIALGGLKEGVNPLSMASAYAPLANNGTFFEAISYSKVEDHNGKVILNKIPDSHIVFKDSRTPSIMTYMLRDVVENGTAHNNINIRNKNGEYIPTAGKTGTSSNVRDVWFVGYTPFYTCAVWYGYDNAKQIPDAEYFSSVRLWNIVMNKLHENIKPVEFTSADGLIKKEVCIYSGQLPTDLCRKDNRGNAVQSELFMKGTEPRESCTLHKKMNVCTYSRDIFGKYYLAGPFCKDTGIISLFGTYRSVMPDIRPGDPLPLDWSYELSHKLCPFHVSRSQNSNTINQNKNKKPNKR